MPTIKKPQPQTSGPSHHALAFFARIDAGEFTLPDGALMRLHEIGLRIDKPTKLLRYWITTYREDIYRRIMEERATAPTRRLRALPIND